MFNPQMFRRAFRVISLGYKLQHYVVREKTQIYKTMISLDSYISFASTNKGDNIKT